MKISPMQPIYLSYELDIEASELDVTKNRGDPNHIKNKFNFDRLAKDLGCLGRKRTCPFCNIECSNFARHIQRNHDDEVSAQMFLTRNQ